MITFDIPGHTAPTPVTQINHARIGHSVVQRSHQQFLGGTSYKLTHARQLEEGRKNFPVGSIITFTSNYQPTSIMAYRVEGYNEMWKDCQCRMNGQEFSVLVCSILRPGMKDHIHLEISNTRHVTSEERNKLIEEGRLTMEDVVINPPNKEYLSRSNILKRQRERLKAKIGDVVHIKGSSQKGKIVSLIDDPSKCEWKHQTQPWFIEVLVELVDKEHNLVYGSQTKFYPFKMIKV